MSNTYQPSAVGAMVRCKCDPPVYGYVVRHHSRERWSLVRTDYGSSYWPWRDLVGVRG